MPLGTPSTADHPALARYLRWFRETPDSLVGIEGWPESGRGLLMDGLARALGAPDLDVDQLDDAAPPGWYRWRVAEPAHWRDIRAWQRAEPGRRVFVRGTGQRDALPPACTWLPPSMLLLRLEEIDEWRVASGLASALWAEQLGWWSGGWYGPLHRLQATWARLSGQSNVEPLNPGPPKLSPPNPDDRSVLASVASSVWEALPATDRQVLGTMAVVGPIPLAAWRRAFERLRHASSNGDPQSVIARWFPDARPTDTLGVPPLFVEEAVARPGADAFAAVRAAWLTSLASVLASDGDAEGVRRLCVLGADRPAALAGRTSRLPGTTPKPIVELRLLGHAHANVLAADDPPREIHWRLRRSFQAVAFLALAAARRASRVELVEALWPFADPDVIRKNFHPVLSDARRTVRRAVGRPDVEGVVYQQGTYRLDERIEWRIDVDAFERDSLMAPEQNEFDSTDSDPTPVEPSVLDAWLGAWRSYRGPLIDGFDAAWVTARRAPLTRRYLALLRRIGRACAHAGRTTEALDAYRSALLEDPYDEPIHRAVMNLYGAQGRRDLVLVQFLRLQDHLKELNVEPRAATQQCYDRLMRADSTVDDVASRT